MKSLLSLSQALSICLILIFLALFVASYDLNFYHKFQVENNIPELSGESQDSLDQISKDLVEYLKRGEEGFLRKYFNDREVFHMRDVFELYSLARKICLIVFLYLIVTLVLALRIYETKEYIKSLRSSLLGILIGFVVFSLIIMGDFSKYFLVFHHIFFDNDLWILNPQTDLMIRMLPQNFFQTIVIKILLMFLASFVFIIFFLTYIIKLKENFYDTTSR